MRGVIVVVAMLLAGCRWQPTDLRTVQGAVQVQAKCDEVWQANHCPGRICTYEEAQRDGMVAAREAAGLLVRSTNGQLSQCTGAGLDCGPPPTRKQIRVAIKTIKRVCGNGRTG